MGEPYPIRRLEPDDGPAIVGIEHAVFSDPWPVEAFVALMGPYALGAHHGGRLVGFVLGRSAADEGEVLNLAVLPDQRRQGVARALLSELSARLADNGVNTVFLEVRESNREARRFYEKAGFEVVGRRPGYYRLPREDALVMRRRIGGVQRHA